MESRKLENDGSSASSSAPPHTFNVTQSPACSPGGRSPLTVCGHSLQTTADKHSDVFGNPVYGLYTSRSGHSEFGGLGLGLPTLVAHPQVSAFQEWWRPAEAQTSGSAAFFPPFLALHPLFLSAFKSFDPVEIQAHTSGENGTVNSGRVPPPVLNSTVNSGSLPVKDKKEKAKLLSGQSQKSPCGSLCSRRTIPKTKGKKPVKRPSESSGLSGCLLGSESSSDEEETSSEPDDEDDPGSDDSESEKEIRVKREVSRLTHTSEKKKRPRAAHRSTTQDHLCPSVPVTSSFQLQASSHPPGLDQSMMSPSLQRSWAAEEEDQQHVSVIRTSGGSHRQTRPSAFKTSSSTPLKNIRTLNSTKHLSASPSPYQSPSSSLKPLDLCSPHKSLSHCSVTRSPTLSASKEPLHRGKILTKPNKHTRESSRDLPPDGSAPPNNPQLTTPLRVKDCVKQASSERLENQRETHSPVQVAPLALITKPRSQSRSPNSEPLLGSTYPLSLMPINLSTGTKETSYSSAFKSSASSGLVPGSGRDSVVLNGGRSLTKPVDSTRSSERERYSSEGSDDSYDEDDGEVEESGNSLSDSESDPESDDSEDHTKECAAMDADRSPRKPVFASNFSSNHSLFNQQITTPLLLPNINSLNPILNSPNTPSPSALTKGSGRRRAVPDDGVLLLPLKFGWQRETRIRTVAGRPQGKVAYLGPCGKKLRQYSDVTKYLMEHGITEISRENFSFSTKVKVGDFYEAQEGPEGLQWLLLAEDEVAPSTTSVDGRRTHRLKLEHQSIPDDTGVRCPLTGNRLQDANDAKLLRKLEAQEIARQAAQIKMKRKLEKQAIARAAKEEKRRRAMMAAEERRKKREEMKIFKQQEKIKRIQHIRMEKELRAQQVLEEKRKRKEAAANAKLLETQKRNEEKEIRRLQAVLLKQQELERHKLEMERERRRQHMMLVKAVEAQRKAEEKERLKQERNQKKRINKEKKLELRRLELEKAKELKKPNEDMCLADHKPLPELSCMPGLILPGKIFSDCLMVLQFLRNFGKVLKLDSNSDSLTISHLQQGLLNVGDGMHEVQDLLVSMLSAAVCDPGIPAGCKCKTILGDHLTNVEINRDNVSEILQIYMESHSDDPALARLAVSLKTKAFQAHSPSQKAAVLAFLVNELCCSRAVISEIDKNIDCMTNLRKNKWIVEGKLRELKNIHAKSVARRASCVRGAINRTFNGSTFRNECQRTEKDSEEEEFEDEDSEDEEEDEDLAVRKRKKDEGARSGSIGELEKQIETTSKLQSQIQQKLFDSSYTLRSMTIGEDRFRRRYWLLPKCGGVFVEGVQNCEGSEHQEEERSEVIRVKEEQQEREARKIEVSVAHISECDQNKNNLFLHNPSSFSQLRKVFEVAKTTEAPPSESYSFHPTSQMDTTVSPESSGLGAGWFTCSNWIAHSPPSISHHEQPSKMFTEKCREWFSLLPRSPCDESSVTSSSSSPTCSSSPQPLRNNPLFTNPPATANQTSVAGIDGIRSLLLQEAEGNGNLCSEESNNVLKSETPFLSDSILAVEVAKTQDYPHALPIPGEMLCGWWRVSDTESLQTLVKALHSRGVRERVLQEQIQKHTEHMAEIFSRGKEFDMMELKMKELSREDVESWCVEERAMEVDINLLRQVEALEQKVISANLQVKGWMPCESQSDRENWIYYEHKHSSLSPRESNQGESPVPLTRRPNNPLDVAICRLSELERNIQPSKQELAAGTKLWHRALDQVRSSAQLSLCFQQLQKSIAWDRAIIKVRCLHCRRKDNKEVLLICAGCDKGCHTYCHSPQIPTVPDGGWFCPFCLAKGSGEASHSGKQRSPTAGEGKRCREERQNSKPSVARGDTREEAASSSSVPKSGTKEFKKRRRDDSSQARNDSPARKSKTSKDSSSELAVCHMLLAELEAHRCAWPFLTPVNHKAVPGYKKVIKRPMDFSTIKEKLTSNHYLNLETFIADINLVFDNCKKFNEDQSEIGKAGYNMKRFFNKRWTELLQ
ncbi:bromodomain adjacent to zinc finger domain protein 2B isoform X2 [Nothobranchius furzeri]|uniref:Transcript variant X3 n=1 Tax=Nothobranchius furzeri TaxID=105023 RepID=A0A9D2Y8C4_NOTFU|nr:bromodomain adjacent to zinc finger domain protein 2B isoform X2 [Nothobranchius furzeri]KAF7215937.1 transcript variant X3 [Nothobranchius furzeri]